MDRYTFYKDWVGVEKETEGDWVKWEDVEKLQAKNKRILKFAEKEALKWERAYTAYKGKAEYELGSWNTWREVVRLLKEHNETE